MENKKILIIEDEVKLARFIELELKYEGYDVIVAHDGRIGLENFISEKPELIILDLMLPELNGFEVLRRLRKDSNIPVIMLTARGEVMDKVMGLDSGADDYMTKPFAIEELLARMRVAFKKNKELNLDEEHILRLKNIIIDTQQRLVKINETVIELTKTEYELLTFMIKNKNIVLNREQILNKVWGYDYLGETNVVDVYIRYLRTKIDDTFKEKYIHTLRGVGYLAKDED